jgi:uncharacterized SAM-binding protein YcdF (DUF218 family)
MKIDRPVAGLALAGAAALLARDLDLPTLVSYWYDRTPLVAAATLLLFLLWLTRLRAVVVAGTAALALLWLVVAFTPLTRLLADGLVRRDPVRDADAVFVLATDLQDDGELTTPAMSRLLHGLELLADGRAPRLVLSELREPRPRYAVPARELIAHLKVPGELLTVGPVDNTHDEALAVARLFRERKLRRVLLVTSPTHSRRAAAAFEHERLEVISSPSVETRFDLERLTKPDDRMFAFGSIVHERLGLLVYRWRGWIS